LPTNQSTFRTAKQSANFAALGSTDV
jgi:hypothetical protein